MRTYRLLFVDDEEAILSALRKYFEKLGHEVSTATSGKEALGLYTRVRPHVVILDLKMPGMSGLEVLEALGKKNAVVIMLTAHGEIESAVEAMRLGAENFLQKPIDMAHLVAAVDKAAEKADLKEENRQLRARLVPSVKRRLAQAAVILVLVGVAVGLGALIGAESSERPTRPIPVPIQPEDTLSTLDPDTGQ